MKILKRVFGSAWFWLFIISVLPLFPLLSAGIPLTHDGYIHIARIANFYASLSEGNIVPRWASNLNWGYGSPILEFVYPLPSYLASLFHAGGISLVDSTKLVFGLSYIAGIVAMYLWIREEWGEKAGIIAASLYGYAPYRFVDLYVRGALGEHMAFVFAPLACYFIKRCNVLGLSLSIAGLILSHNALALVFLPVILLYGIYVGSTKRVLLPYMIIGCCFGLLLSAFFWVPALFEAKYTLQDIITKNAIAGNFVPWSWFFYSPWNYGGSLEFSKNIGIIHWAAVIVMLVLLPKAKKRMRVLYIILLFLFILSLFLMTKQSTVIWSQIHFLQKFQFPWRLLSLTVFVSSIIGALVFSRLPTRIIGMILIILVVSSFGMWKPKGYIVEPETTYTGVFDGTTDSGELSPKWSVRFMEHRPKQNIEIVSGDAVIEEGKRNTTSRQYVVESQSETQLVENTLYFPGWSVYVDDVIVPIEFQDPHHRGLITFFVPRGTYTVTIVFTDTKIRRTANWISVLSIVPLICFL